MIVRTEMSSQQAKVKHVEAVWIEELPGGSRLNTPNESFPLPQELVTYAHHAMFLRPVVVATTFRGSWWLYCERYWWATDAPGNPAPIKEAIDELAPKLYDTYAKERIEAEVRLAALELEERAKAQRHSSPDESWIGNQRLDGLQETVRLEEERLIAEAERLVAERRHAARVSWAKAVLDGAEPSETKRPGLSSEVRKTVYDRDGGTCRMCASRFELQYDHVIPIALGGASSVENLQLLCGACNRRKGATVA